MVKRVSKGSRKGGEFAPENKGKTPPMPATPTENPGRPHLNDYSLPEEQAEYDLAKAAYQVFLDAGGVEVPVKQVVYIKSTGRARILSVGEYYETLLGFGVDPETAAKAADVLANNPPVLIATSGKLASGKDTIAAAVMQGLRAKEQVHLSVAAPLKDEVQEVFNIIRASETPEEAAGVISRNRLGIPLDKATHLVDLAWEGAKAEPNVTSRDRTPWTRLALQYWGVEVRREQDPKYWENKLTLAAAEKIAAGENIMVTDARFPGEVETLQKIGFTVLRLEITPETQATRLGGRDGLAIDPKALVHTTETALDDYTAFDFIIDNNERGVDETVADIVSKFYIH